MLCQCWPNVHDVGQHCNNINSTYRVIYIKVCVWWIHTSRGVPTKLVRCWSTVCDAGPTLNQLWVSAMCLLSWAQNRKSRFYKRIMSLNAGPTPAQCWHGALHVGPSLCHPYSGVGIRSPGSLWLSAEATHALSHLDPPAIPAGNSCHTRNARTLSHQRGRLKSIQPCPASRRCSPSVGLMLG